MRHFFQSRTTSISDNDAFGQKEGSGSPGEGNGFGNDGDFSLTLGKGNLGDAGD